MEYKGRIIGVLLVVIVHTTWITYGFFTHKFNDPTDIIFHVISLSIEITLAYIFGKKFDSYKFLSERDFLSKLYNRRYIFNIFPKLTSQLDPSEKINVFVIDVNDFKAINDTYGHKKGDNVLKGISKCLKNNMRDTDIVARLGGDEFLLLVPNQEVVPTELIFKRLEKSLNKLSTKHGIDISISIGKSVFPNDSETLDDLIKLADNKMYEHKFQTKKNNLFKKSRQNPNNRMI